MSEWERDSDTEETREWWQQGVRIQRARRQPAAARYLPAQSQCYVVRELGPAIRLAQTRCYVEATSNDVWWRSGVRVARHGILRHQKYRNTIHRGPAPPRHHHPITTTTTENVPLPLPTPPPPPPSQRVVLLFLTDRHHHDRIVRVVTMVRPFRVRVSGRRGRSSSSYTVADNRPVVPPPPPDYPLIPYTIFCYFLRYFALRASRRARIYLLPT